MKELLHLIPSYIKDSRDLLREITTLTLPKGAGLFIADATAMYTNITLEHELKVLWDILETHSHLIPPKFPSAFSF